MAINPPPPPAKSALKKGFTLIEMSIVLVVIGLIAGGILVAQDLIRAAGERSQITQMEKYNSAVNTFRGKYGALPGDLTSQTATIFGFTARGSLRAQGDGNGEIEGDWGGGTPRMVILAGEAALFWNDLSQATLIEGIFNTANCCNPPAGGPNITPISNPSLSAYAPLAKIGQGNYIIVYSNISVVNSNPVNAGVNYFALQNIAGTINGHGELNSTPILTLIVRQAYDIDTKTDDGLPQNGHVTAQFVGQNLGGAMWASGTASSGNYGASSTAATAGASTTCYDNSTSGSGTPGNAGVTQHYSVEIGNGSNPNCALSFQFQ